jgi:hypothetical protein
VYAEPLSKAKLAKRVPEEIAKAFDRPDIKAALDYSFERSADDIREYLEANFNLRPVSEVPHTAAPEAVSPAIQVGVQEEPNGPQNGDEPPSIEAPPDDTEHDGEIEVQEPQFQTVTAAPPRPRPAPHPAQPSVIELFAKAQGFRKDGSDHFYHSDGSSIARTAAVRFPWQRRNADGDLVRYYWIEDHCLESEPLELDAEVWSLIDESPETYALILLSLNSQPVELTGARLRAMRDSGELNLYPATYRIVYGHDREI